MTTINQGDFFSIALIYIGLVLISTWQMRRLNSTLSDNINTIIEWVRQHQGTELVHQVSMQMHVFRASYDRFQNIRQLIAVYSYICAAVIIAGVVGLVISASTILYTVGSFVLIIGCLSIAILIAEVRLMSRSVRNTLSLIR